MVTRVLRAIVLYIAVGAASVALLLGIAHLTVVALISIYANLAPYTGAG